MRIISLYLIKTLQTFDSVLKMLKKHTIIDYANGNVRIIGIYFSFPCNIVILFLICLTNCKLYRIESHSLKIYTKALLATFCNKNEVVILVEFICLLFYL